MNIEIYVYVFLLKLASAQLKLKSNQQREDDSEKSKLRAELDRLRSSRLDHEREAMEVQNMLEEKMEELKNVTEDLYQSQDAADKLQVIYYLLNV